MRRASRRAATGRGPRIRGPLPAAIVAAGGRGDRVRSAGDAEPKQFQLLEGRSLLQRSIDTLRAGGCGAVVVALPPDLLARSTDLLEDDREIVIVAGGDRRQDSVYNALGLVHSERVVVHDAARPLAGAELVMSVLEALADWDGAVAAVPLEDTLKKVEEGLVLGTVERTGLWKAQTPQAFRTRVLREAHDRARADGAEATDDAGLLERIGKTVGVVPGKSTNMKITYPDDMLVAGALLRSERG